MLEILSIISPIVLFVLGYILNGLNSTIKELNKTVKEIQTSINTVTNKTSVLEAENKNIQNKMNRYDNEFEKIGSRQAKQDEMINSLRMAHNSCEHKKIMV